MLNEVRPQPVAAAGNRFRQSAIAAAMGLVLLLVSFAAGAIADGGSALDSEPGPLVSSSVDSPAELNALVGEGEEVSTEPETDPTAAELLPHSELDRSEAEDLLVSVFPTATEDLAGIFSEIEVEAFRSDHVAVVSPEDAGSPAGLLSSVLPLRAEADDGTKQPVDLSLESSGSAVVPANPLVDVEFPVTAGEEIRLPESGVGLRLVTSHGQRNVSTIDADAAFYPNVAEDSDLLVAPTPTGLETFTQLRSPAAPNTQRFELTLPAGAALEASDGGGAEVRRNSETLAVVHPPTAVDAEGRPVPVSLVVGDRSIELKTSPGENAAYPILVDPMIEGYAWKFNGSPTGIFTDWQKYVSNPTRFEATWAGDFGGGVFYSGLGLRSFAGPITPGASSNFNYYVPRYFSDFANPEIKAHPLSFIRNMYLGQVYYMVEENPSATDPYLLAGLWDEGNATFHTSTVRLGTQGSGSDMKITLPNTQENTNVKNGGIALTSFAFSSYRRQIFVGEASVEVSDKDFPSWGYLVNPGVWMNSSPAALDYSVGDLGLGVHSFSLKQPKAEGGIADINTPGGCVGSAANPCPPSRTTATTPLIYNPAAMAQGENTVTVTAMDTVFNKTDKLVKIKVDHDAPTLGLSGNLTEQASVGTKLAKYTLNYTANDGDDAAAAAIAPVGTVGTGTGQIERPFGIDADGAGNIWISDTTNNRVVELDKNGNYVRQITTTPEGAFKEIRGLAVAPDGNVWVAEKGNKRVMKFSPTGQFISKFTNSAIVEPMDVAVGNTGTVWVTDPSAQRVFQFKEDGTLIRSIGNPAVSSELPFGIDLDEFGNAWVAMQGSNRVVEISSSGSKLFSFGTSGTATGQFNAPFDISIAPSGNIFVSDGLNNRIQEFKPDGSFLRTFGTVGTASNQLKEPKNIAVAPDNKLLVADYGNKRIARWEHADQDPQSGVVKVQIKVDGTVKATNAPGCAAGKNCSLSGSWTLNADEYTVGTHKVEVVATDGVNLVGEKSLNVETHGDRTAPTVSLTGSLTEQATLGKTLPAYKVKVAATDLGPAEERKSGVASIVIKVDGTTVDSTSPGCPAEGCSLNREWTLKSSSFFGFHLLEAIVTDAAGKSKSVFREFEIKPDTTAPELTLSGALAEAPDGWVQDGTRSLTTDATDVGGYGVKQTRFQIDGQIVGESLIQTCELGGCAKSKTFWTDMTVFGGGAHEGVAIAEDLAGNIRKKTWTINIDPLGNIAVSEATDTLEAVEVTAPEVTDSTSANGVVSNAPTETGVNPGLTQGSGQLESAGSPTPSTVNSNVAQGFSVETTATAANGQTDQTTITVAPANVPSGVGTPQIVEGSAAVIPNSSSSTDTVIRPVYMGLMSFQDIRDATAPESYSWLVKLGPEESLKSIDSQNAGVYWEDGTQVMLIASQSAHDAQGATVPTALSVSGGNIITLTVQHREPGLVYPVIAGVGWEGGFQTETATVVEPKEEVEELSRGIVGPPEALPITNTDSDGASASTARRHYTMPVEWEQCFSDTDILGFKPGCNVGKLLTELKFEYNHRYAWWKESKPHPKCPNSSSVLAMNLAYCNWAGANHQPYEHGYHISALNESIQTSLGAATFTETEHLTIYMYGDGYAKGHDTNHVCNPLSTC